MLTQFNLETLNINFANIQVRAKANGYVESGLSNSIEYGWANLYTYELSEDENYYILTGVKDTRPTDLRDLEIPTSYKGLPIRFIATYAFKDATWLNSIYIPGSIIGISAAAFLGCNNITKITIPFVGTGAAGAAPDDDYNNPSDFGVIFNYGYPHSEINTYVPESLKKVVISGYSNDIARNVFENCQNIEEIVIEDGVVSIGEDAFKGCTSLSEVTTPDTLLTIEDGAFENCDSLYSLRIGAGIESIGDAFRGCIYFENLHLQNIASYCEAGVLYSPAAESVMDTTLYIGKTRVYDLVIPDGVTKVGGFSGFKELSSVHVADSVETILPRAFVDCYITSVYIGHGVTQIKESAFLYCPVEEVYYPGTEEEWNAITIESGNDDLLNARIYFRTALRLADGKYEIDSNDDTFNVKEEA